MSVNPAVPVMVPVLLTGVLAVAPDSCGVPGSIKTVIVFVTVRAPLPTVIVNVSVVSAPAA